MKRNMMWLWIVAAAALSACSNAGYYAQSIKGQMEIWRESRPIDVVLADSGVDAKTKSKLRMVLDIRQFAVDQLRLPDNGSYTEFVDLERSFVVWSVFAAPELSLQPQEWCFVVVGCVTYRGYFEKKSAEAFARQLSDQGQDVYIGGVPAYSTLGWFDDPVPNTVMHYSEAGLAALIFHELAHQVAFAKGDTVFNESFATTVERVGVEKWLEFVGDEEGIEHYRQGRERNERVVALILEYRARLQDLYVSHATSEEKRAGKQRLVDELRQDYATITADWENFSGYRRWFEQPINNAKLVSVATYNDLVPEFGKLLERQQGDLEAFYQSVRELAVKPKAERHEALRAL